jgi:4-hydroxy-3-methylbut-2-enyl diphosphate reductase
MGTVERVRIARRTGFCYGVREAIDHARVSAMEGRDTITLGQTVHNEGVIADLRARGIRTVDTIDAIEPGASVVIRAHGVTPDIRERALARGLDVIDGTCSWVEQEHREVAKLVAEGYTIVLLGTPNHPEVVGILGYAPDAIVVDEEEEWDAVPRTKRMALVSQSTQPPWKFQKLAAFMVSRAHELRIVNTVCPVTIRRQEDTIALAREVDFMVVVGGRNSANTKELTRLVGIEGRPVVQIERASDLTDATVFEGYRVVGITGGTSTPIEDLEAVAARVLELAGTTETQAQATTLAAAAIAEVAEPAYRSTSIGRPDRSPVPASRRSPVAAAHA